MMTLEDGFDPILVSKINQQIPELIEDIVMNPTSNRFDLMEQMTTMLERFGEQNPTIMSKQLYESHPMMVFGECKEHMCTMSRSRCPSIRLMIEEQFSNHLSKQLESFDGDRFKIGIHGMGGFLTELLILTKSFDRFEAEPENITELHITGDKFGEFIEYLTLEIAGDKNKVISLDQIKFPELDKTNYYRVKFFIMIRIMEWFKTMGHIVHIYLHTESNILKQRAQLDAFMALDYVDQFVAQQIHSGYAIANSCVKQGGLSMLARTSGLMQQPEFFIEIRRKEINIDEDEEAYDYVLKEKQSELNTIVSDIQKNTSYYVNLTFLNNNTSDTSIHDADDDPFAFIKPENLCKIDHPAPMALTLTELKEHASSPQKYNISSNKMIFTRLSSGEVCEFIIETTPEVANMEILRRGVESNIMSITQEYYDEAFDPIVQYNGLYKPLIKSLYYIWIRMTTTERLQYVASIPLRIGLGFLLFAKDVFTYGADTILNRFGYYRQDDLRQFRFPELKIEKCDQSQEILDEDESEEKIKVVPISGESQEIHPEFPEITDEEIADAQQKIRDFILE